MGDYHVVIGWIAASVFASGNVCYLYAMLPLPWRPRPQRPNRVSWCIWALGGALYYMSYTATGEGADNTAHLSLLGASVTMLIALGSLWLGEGGKVWVEAVRAGLALCRGERRKLALTRQDRLDALAVLGLAVGLAAWQATDAFVGLICFMVIDVIGSLPTLSKTYDRPRSENLVSWWLWSAGAILNLFALSDWSIRFSLFPCMLAASTIIMVACISVRRLKVRE